MPSWLESNTASLITNKEIDMYISISHWGLFPITKELADNLLTTGKYCRVDDVLFPIT